MSALAPSEVVPEDFGEGGFFSTDASAVWAEGVVAAALAETQDSVLLGLESLAQRSDGFFDSRAEERARAWFYGDEVYWCYLPEDAGERPVRDALDRPRGYAMNAVSVVSERPPGVESDLDVDQLRFLAERVRLIVIEIFDGEGYAVWRPAPRA